MLKYLFNDKIQITYKVGIPWWGIETKCQQKYGESDIYNTAIGLGKLNIFF